MDELKAMTFQARVDDWLMACFGEQIARDRTERNHRFLEEALELVQSCGCTASEAHQLVDYTFGRLEGEPRQEAGGVMVTLAALCLANELDMQHCGAAELARVSVPATMAKVRAKQAAKPKHSPLPESPSTDEAAVERVGELPNSFQLMQDFYVSRYYEPKPERPADNIQAAIEFAIDRVKSLAAMPRKAEG